MATNPENADVSEKKPALRRELSLRDLTLFGIVCLIGPRWLPVAAHAGSGSIVLWLLASLLFGIPLAIAVETLMSTVRGSGGLYAWTQNTFGPAHGFLAFWIYWVGMAVWFPGMAVFYVSSSIFSLGQTYEHLADSRMFILCASLAAVWIALLANLIGLKTGKWLENAGAIAVALLGAILIIAAAFRWHHDGSATQIILMPKISWNTAIFWAAIAYGITGAEYFGMMSDEIRSPEKTVKPAIWISTVFVAVFYAATTLALLVLLPPQNISEIHGLVDGGKATASVFGMPSIVLFMGLLLLLHGFGAFGGVGTAISRMPFAAGTDRLLPHAFSHVHPRWHTPHVALLTLGVVASALLLLSQLGDSLRVAYQEIVSLTLIGGFLPYIYIFISTWKAGKRVGAVLGLGVTIFSLVCTVVPTSDVTNVWLYEGKLALGTVAMIGSGLWLYFRGHKRMSLDYANPALSNKFLHTIDE
jgi:amino acid transporter